MFGDSTPTVELRDEGPHVIATVHRDGRQFRVTIAATDATRSILRVTRLIPDRRGKPVWRTMPLSAYRAEICRMAARAYDAANKPT